LFDLLTVINGWTLECANLTIVVICFDRFGNKDSKGYDTYTVKKETPISLEGKASPKSVKTYNKFTCCCA
jgi:hypothetical protein